MRNQTLPHIAPLLLAALLPCHALAAATLSPLWEIGKSDNANEDFALAPGKYSGFKEDGFFVVGQSSAARDWPYVQPGPADAWAGQRPHTYVVVFGLKAAPRAGTCHLMLDFLDTHSSSPPRLRIEINGRRFDKGTINGAGDASVMGQPGKGRESVLDLPFEAEVLKPGNNEVLITTVSGSWLLYDSVRLLAPAGTELAPVESGTRVVHAHVSPVWLKDGGAAIQPVTVKLRHIGAPGSATLRLGDLASRTVELVNGLQTVELAPRAPEGPRTAELVLDSGGRREVAATLELRPPRIRNLWILPHSHVDIGYTHVQDEVIDIQISNLKTGMKLAAASAGNPPGMRFKWNPEAVWSIDHFLTRATPQERDAFVKAVQKGDVGIDGMFGNMLTALCRPEELAQCFTFGARLSNLTGVPVESAAICDVPGWTWGIVPIMAQAGIKYFAIGPNFSDRVGTIHIWDNKPFYWMSQSGREKLLCWVVDNYHHLGNMEEHVLAHVGKLDAIDFPYDTSFLFWVGQWPNGGVDNAPPDEQTVEKVMAWNQRYAAPTLRIGLAREFFQSFEAAHGARLPEHRGDLTPYWEDGAGSTARETAMNRASADRLSQAQVLFAMRDPGAFPLANFDAAWKNVLLYSEHTWGAWCSISKPDDPFTLDQWKIKQSFALKADQQSRELLERSLPKGTKSSGWLEVFNTTQWERTGLVTVPGELVGESVLEESGSALPSQRLASGELVFLARAVPAFGSRNFRVSPENSRARGSARAEGAMLRNDKLSVEVDRLTGAIRSLRLAGSKHDWVDADAPVGLNDFRYLPGVDVSKAQTNAPVTIRVLEAGPLVAALQVESEAPGCERLVREVRVTHGLDYVEVVNHVDRKSVREKDGVHFGFGFHVPEGRIHMETPWAVVRPNLDQLPGSCRNWFTVQRWVDISNADLGVTWASLDAPLLQLGGMTANLLGAVPFDRWMTNAIESPTIYSWAQNNHWHTNYKVDQPGVTTFRFLMRPHRQRYSPRDAARFGVETSRPLIAVASTTSRGRTLKPLLSLASDDILVETIKPSTDGRALILGLFGVTGEQASARIKWSGQDRGMWLTDLTEKPLQRLQGRVEVPPYGVVYLRAE